MSIGELFIELGVIGHPEEVEKFNKKIKETAKSMDLTIKSAVKANSGIKDLENGFKAFIATVKAFEIILSGGNHHERSCKIFAGKSRAVFGYSGTRRKSKMPSFHVCRRNGRKAVVLYKQYEGSV